MGWGDNTKGPWGSLGGKDNKPKSPAPSGGGGNQQGPNKFGGNNNKGGNKPQFDFNKYFKKPTGNGQVPEISINAKGILMIILLAIMGWALTGFYVVDASEEGIVQRFGKYHHTAAEGLRYHFPAPFEKVYLVKKTVINSIQIGYRSGSNSTSSYRSSNAVNSLGRSGANANELKQPKESLMITGDTNIADVSFTVQWRIKNSFNYLFQVANPVETMPDTIKAVSESAMREVIGRTNFAEAMTTKRAAIENDVKTIIQSILNSYNSGIEIYAVNLNDVQNPDPVMPAFLDVETAKQDRETAINRALAYKNEIIPRARGEAQKIFQDADAYKQEVVSVASGDAQRFASIYNEYTKAKDVTRRRIYLDTMKAIMSGTDKVIIDSKNGAMPYLPLPDIKKSRQAAPEQTTNESAKNDESN